MVRRGILLILAGAFWLVGALGMYQHIKASAMFQANSKQNTTDTMSYQLPFSIPGTDLMALELRSYEGLSLEDGSKEAVSNVTALVIRNDGTQLLENAQVEIWQGQEKLYFELSYLPAGAKILVLESNRRQYTQDAILACSGNETPAPKDIPGLVTIRSIESKTLLITNPGPIPLKHLKVYFKNYDPESAMFLGGIVYEISIYRLAPGETHITQSQYYSGETSRIVKIMTSG